MDHKFPFIYQLVYQVAQGKAQVLQGALFLSKFATPETAAGSQSVPLQSSYYLALGAAGALFRSAPTCISCVCLLFNANEQDFT